MHYSSVKKKKGKWFVFSVYFRLLRIRAAAAATTIITAAPMAM
jgi:hypothetical protein